MNIMNWYLAVLKKYFEFEGRSGRQEFWMFVVFNIVFSIAASIIDSILGLSYVFSSLYGLAVFLPGLGVSVRRLHDIGKSGWMVLVSLIPIAGIIWLIVLWAKEGDMSNNSYGPVPQDVIA